MASDVGSAWLVTGDTDGVIKTWKIVEYCVEASEVALSAPRKFCFSNFVVLQNFPREHEFLKHSSILLGQKERMVSTNVMKVLLNIFAEVVLSL